MVSRTYKKKRAQKMGKNSMKGKRIQKGRKSFKRGAKLSRKKSLKGGSFFQYYPNTKREFKNLESLVTQYRNRIGKIYGEKYTSNIKKFSSSDDGTKKFKKFIDMSVRVPGIAPDGVPILTNTDNIFKKFIKNKEHFDKIVNQFEKNLEIEDQKLKELIELMSDTYYEIRKFVVGIEKNISEFKNDKIEVRNKQIKSLINSHFKSFFYTDSRNVKVYKYFKDRIVPPEKDLTKKFVPYIDLYFKEKLAKQATLVLGGNNEIFESFFSYEYNNQKEDGWLKTFLNIPDGVEIKAELVSEKAKNQRLLNQKDGLKTMLDNIKSQFEKVKTRFNEEKKQRHNTQTVSDATYEQLPERRNRPARPAPAPPPPEPPSTEGRRPYFTLSPPPSPPPPEPPSTEGRRPYFTLSPPPPSDNDGNVYGNDPYGSTES
jgi:hypothetical protein